MVDAATPGKTTGPRMGFMFIPAIPGIPDLGLRDGSQRKLDRMKKKLVNVQQWESNKTETVALKCQIKIVKAEGAAERRVMKAAAKAHCEGVKKASFEAVKAVHNERMAAAQHQFSGKVAEIQQRVLSGGGGRPAMGGR